MEGYATGRSYKQGEKVGLCLSAHRRTEASLIVQRVGAETLTVKTFSVHVGPKPIPRDASERGCGWDEEGRGDIEYEVPAEWSPGLYRVSMSDMGDDRRPSGGEAFFVVRDAVPGKRSKVLLVLATNTYCAYNNYGSRRDGRDLSTKGSFYEKARQASFLRPLPRGFLSTYDCGAGRPISRQQRYAGWDKWEWPFVQWAERQGYALEYATSEDLDREPDLLKAYRLVLSVGHDEYWSAGMRAAMEDYAQSGGNAVFLSGNVCYRKVGYDRAGSRLTLEGEMDGDALWSHRLGPNRSENRLTGVSFCYGALNPEPVPYRVYRPDHWLFQGLWTTGRKSGELPLLGRIGYECDGCDIEWSNGLPIASGRDGTPESFQILALAPGRMPDYEATVHSNALFNRPDGFTPWGKDLRRGAAVMGLWHAGGTVLTVGCTEWARQLHDPMVAHVTRNILQRLSRGKVAIR